MRTVKLPKAALSRRLATLALGAAAALAIVAGVEVEAAAPQIAFKLNPRLTLGRYMGERWVTPTSYTQVQEFPKDLTVGARSHNSVSWTSANPSIVTVTPSVGSEVAIKVNRPGRTTVTAGGVLLNVTAQMAGTGVLVVQIQQ